MLYSEWLDQDRVGWIQVSLLTQSLAWLLGFGANHSLCLFFNIGAIILRPDKYNILTKFKYAKSILGFLSRS